MAIGLHIAKLAGGAHGVAADDDVTGLLVEERANRAVLRRTARIHGREASQGLALQVRTFGLVSEMVTHPWEKVEIGSWLCGFVCVTATSRGTLRLVPSGDAPSTDLVDLLSRVAHFGEHLLGVFTELRRRPARRRADSAETERSSDDA